MFFCVLQLRLCYHKKKSTESVLTCTILLTIVRYMNDISIVRKFNRTVTQRIGVLDAQFLGRHRSLGASRLLYEIGISGAEVRDLRSRLGLDSGYMSRLLRTLEAEGLIMLRPSPNDSRVRTASLTKDGERELKRLDVLSDEAAAFILEPLSEKQRRRLLEGMEIVERMLTAGLIVMEVVPPESRDARLCIESYFTELNDRFENGFDPGDSISASDNELTPPNGYFVVARIHDEAIGCGAIKCYPDHGEIKRMWVAKTCRGLGAGRKILGYLEQIARENHIPLLRLETNKVLTEAQAMYRSSGYEEVVAFNNERYAHHWFQKYI